MATFYSVQSAEDAARLAQGGLPWATGVVMKSCYRFLRTKGGKSSFARVWLDIEPGGDTVEVVDALPERVDWEAGEVNRQSAAGWVAAALESIRATLTYAREAGVLA